MTTSKLVGLNTKWYRYQIGITQEEFSNIANFKTAYISVIETGNANLTSNTIDSIAKALKVSQKQLMDEETANLAKSLPPRVDMYKKA